jgi:hypothetical protein
MEPWKPHLYRIGTEFKQFDEAPEDPESHRKHIEPWLSAVFQSEHLSLLVGNGLSLAVGNIAGATTPSMKPITLDTPLNDLIGKAAEESAKHSHL